MAARKDMKSKRQRELKGREKGKEKGKKKNRKEPAGKIAYTKIKKK